MYKRVRIQNFRGLRDLTIDDLGRVNLIVGENSVGKTSLLEAIWLLLSAGEAVQAVSSDQVRGSRFASSTASDNWPLLFHQLETDDPISIVMTEHDGLKTSLNYGPGRARSYRYRQTDASTGRSQAVREAQKSYSPGMATITIPHGVFVSSHREASLLDLAMRFVSARGAVDSGQLVRDLQGLLPNLQGLELDFGPKGDGPPSIVADVGLARPLPLPLLGDGAVHLLEVLLAVYFAAGGVALIDEVESGLYHQNLTAMWEAIDRSSFGRNTQIFATTHSWECIDAAIGAFAKEHTADFRLHRLERDDNGIVRAITFNHDQAHAALDLNLEVR
jgi:predicted ATPase